jgi:phosphopantothenoylcysteine decarboxylase/phosphopantothenate--cysteine ligase
VTILAEKRIILGVTGSIAAYKAAAVASQLTQLGAWVDVIMTESAARFVTPLTFQALTGRPVYTSMWGPESGAESGGGLDTHIAHVGLAHDADLLLIAPITAQTIARLAHGLADDLLSVIALAARCPIVIAPAMDVGMYENPATQANLDTLQRRGVYLAGPTVGRMASGYEGLGRLIEPEEIVGHCRYVLGWGGRLAGRRVVISAGPTQEPLDPVRYLTNYSSGKQGYALAQAALEAGGDVTLISGPVGLPTPVGARRVDVASARQMRDAVLLHAVAEGRADALIMSAAVSDFRPAQISDQKVKKDETSALTLELTRNPDILAEVSEGTPRPRVVIGFAAESEDLLANAQAKLEAKKLDLIVANDITASDAGFAAETNRVHFVTTQGVEPLPLMSKADVAARVIGWLADRLDAG